MYFKWELGEGKVINHIGLLSSFLKFIFSESANKIWQNLQILFAITYLVLLKNVVFSEWTLNEN
jgi:hypothetical protein